MCYYTLALRNAVYAPVAQLDRVTDYESVGRGFESLPAYQKCGISVWISHVFYTRRDSNQQIQMSGGHLFGIGSTTQTP